MNPHLNAFRYYSENESSESLENNLSRALAICIKKDALFLTEFVRNVASHEDFLAVFDGHVSSNDLIIDLQVNTRDLDPDNFRKIYAVGVTASPKLGLDDFFQQKRLEASRTVTDIFISIKDIAFVIEVKRSAENCKEQLFNQIVSLLPEEPWTEKVLPRELSWQTVVKLLERTQNSYSSIGHRSILIEDFLGLIDARFPEWFSPKPFFQLFRKNSNLAWETRKLQLAQRMRQLLLSTGRSLLGYADRLGLELEISSAKEVLLDFSLQNGEEGLLVSIYPGNTKQQGWTLFDRGFPWEQLKNIDYDGKQLQLTTYRHIKFSHWNRYITCIEYEKDQGLKELYTKENFNHSGKWDYNDWPKLEGILDEHFGDNLDWRTASKWKENFLDSDRRYCTVSFGFYFGVWISGNILATIDSDESNFSKARDFTLGVIDKMTSIIEPQK